MARKCKNPNQQNHSGYLLPVHDQQGLEETKKLYKEMTGRDLTDEETIMVLGNVMRYLYLTQDLTIPAKEEQTDPETGSS